MGGSTDSETDIHNMVFTYSDETVREYKNGSVRDVPDYMCIKNTSVYGLEESFRRAKYPMAVDIDATNSTLTNGIKKLAQCAKGEGHDNFLKGIVVQFDLEFTVKAWTEAERYHFLDFISSQSTMHRITKFDLDKAYIEYVDPRIVDIMREKINEYNEMESGVEKDKKYLEVLYSNPVGFRLTAGMTTNYQQLKTIYSQRKNHRLPEWHWFCEWIERLPYSELIIGEE